MKWKVLLVFVLAFYVQRASYFAAPNPKEFENAPGRIQVWELISRLERRHQILICTESTSSDEGKPVLDSLYFNFADFSSKSSLKETLEELSIHVNYITNKKFILLRSKGYDVKNSPLSKSLPPFRFQGTLDEFFRQLPRLGVGDIDIIRVETTGSYDGSASIELAFDSNVTIEDILFILAEKYQLRWNVTIRPALPPRILPSITWSFAKSNPLTKEKSRD